MAEPTEPTVFTAFSAVMESVQGIRKNQRNQDQKFNFRGIDAVLNTVGPKLREHGVIIVPTAEHIEIERYQTAKGSLMQGVIVRMRYTVIGPAGDTFEGSAYGQAADSGDKAVAKAESVAYRTFLLQSLTVPTDDPDPDEFTHERTAHQPPPPDPLNVAKAEALAAASRRNPDMEPDQLKQWIRDVMTSRNLEETLDGVQQLIRDIEEMTDES